MGTALADTSGYVGLIQHTVGELTIDGGSVSLSAGDGVSLQPGSSVDVSGGSINYQGAYVQTTKLVEAGGQIIDISQASPSVAYEGIYTGSTAATDAKWGVTQTTTDPVPLGEYQAGYTEGGNGGTLSITAPAMTLSGSLIGATDPGARQVNSNAISSALSTSLANAGIDPRVWDLNSLPVPAELSLVFEKQYPTGAPDTYAWYDPAPPDIVFQADPSGAPAGALVLSPNLVDANASGSGGFGNLVIDDSADNDQLGSAGNLVLPAVSAYGNITVAANPANPDNPTLQTSPGGSITLAAANIDIEGGVAAPDGKLSFTAYDFSPHNGYVLGIPGYNPDRGNFTLSPDATLSTAGLVVDEMGAPSSGSAGPLLKNGGSITVAGSLVSLEPGSTVQVNGGAEISASGSVTYGAAGSISIVTGEYPGSSYPIFTPVAVLAAQPPFSVGDQIDLPGNTKPLDGYSGSTGGSLTIVAPLIQIGGGTASPAGSLVLSPGFFDNGGFSSYTLNGVGRAETNSSGVPLQDSAGNLLFYPGLAVEPGTVIFPSVQQLQIVPDGESYTWATVNPFPYENTPVNLAFGAVNVANPVVPGVAGLLSRGDLVIGAGSVVETDPQTNPAGGVALSGSTVTVLGSVIAPGGTISITGGADSTKLFTNSSTALPTVDLGPQSVLSTAGTAVYQADAFGNVPGTAGYLPSGEVLAGGTISVSGNIVAEAGSVLDVAGSAAVLALSPTEGGAAPAAGLVPVALTFTPTQVASDAGSIELVGQQELFSTPP